MAIIAAGAAFRFFDLGLVRFSYDQSYPMVDALRILEERVFPLVGQPSSVFLDNPPLMSYLQAVPLLLWRSPWAVYFFIVALNTIAIYFVFRAAQQLLGDGVGLLSAFLFAVNPWVVAFSRTTWVQASIPFFMSLIAWGLWPVLATENRSSARVLIASIAVTAMAHTYIQAFGVLAQIAPLLVIFRKKIPRKPLLAGILIFATAVVIFGAGQLERWDVIQGKLASFLSRDELRLTSEGVEHAMRLVTGQDFDAQAIGQQAGDEVRRIFSPITTVLLSAALVAGLIRAMLIMRRQSAHRSTAIVLLMWFLVPILLTSVSSNPVHPHYLLLTIPAGHILASWGVSPLFRGAGTRWVALAGLIILAVFFGVNLNRMNEDVARSPTSPRFNGWALESAAKVGQAVRDLTEANRFPRRIVADGHSAVLSGMSGVRVKTLSGLDFPSFVVLPGSEPLLYVLVNTSAGPGILGPHQESFVEYDLQFADGAHASFVRVQPYDRSAALALPGVKADWPSESGLSLLGYTLEENVQPGDTIDVTTYWRVDALQPGREEWFIGAFYHLVNPQGQKLAEENGHGQWSRRWEPGDIYVERVSIPVPKDVTLGLYTLEVGLFDSVHARGYSLQSPDGPVYSYSILIAAGQTD